MTCRVYGDLRYRDTHLGCKEVVQGSKLRDEHFEFKGSAGFRA